MAYRSRAGHAAAVGYPDWDRSRGTRDHQAPETGRWDLRQERWIPQPRVPEEEDFGIEPFYARSEPPGTAPRPGAGRVLDHDDWGTGYHRRQEPDQPPRRPVPGSRGRTGEYTSGGRRIPRPPARPPDDEDEYDDEPTNYIGSFVATACWYLVPLFAYAVWAATLSGTRRAGCVDAFGAPCPAPRAEAFTNLFDHVPQVAVAMALSISVAMFLGWATSGWRAMTIGFASAVLGAGVATVLFAVLETQF